MHITICSLIKNYLIIIFTLLHEIYCCLAGVNPVCIINKYQRPVCKVGLRQF